MAFGQLDGLAQHDAHSDLRNVQVGGNFQGFPDEIAIVDESLGRQPGEAGLEESLAFGTGVDDQTRSPYRYRHFDFPPDCIDEGLVREGTDDSGGTDN